MEKMCIFALSLDFFYHSMCCMPKFFLLFFIVLSVTVPCCGQDTVPMSLDSCLRYALLHNISMQSARLNTLSSNADYEGAKMRFAPNVSANASQSWGFRSGGTSSDRNCGINANVTLFDGLNNVRTLQLNRLALDQSGLKEQQNANQLYAQVVQAYLTILMNVERLAYQRKVLSTALKQRDEGAVKQQVGRILESDYLLLDANYLSAAANVENTQLTLSGNRLALRTLLAMPVNVVPDAVRSSDTLHSSSYTLLPVDSVVTRAMANIPDLKISQMNVEMARYSVQLAQSAFWPTLGFSAGGNYYGGSSGQVDGAGNIITASGFNGSVGLSLSIPIFNSGVTATQVKRSKINLQQAQLQQYQTEMDLDKEIRDQYVATAQSLNQFRSSEQMALAYKASYEVYALKYEQGTVTTVEMLQQQDRYLSALNDYLINKYSFILNQQLLNIYMGVPCSL